MDILSEIDKLLDSDLGEESKQELAEFKKIAIQGMTVQSAGELSGIQRIRKTLKEEVGGISGELAHNKEYWNDEGKKLASRRDWCQWFENLFIEAENNLKNIENQVKDNLE